MLQFPELAEVQTRLYNEPSEEHDHTVYCTTFDDEHGYSYRLHVGRWGDRTCSRYDKTGTMLDAIVDVAPAARFGVGGPLLAYCGFRGRFRVPSGPRESTALYQRIHIVQVPNSISYVLFSSYDHDDAYRNVYDYHYVSEAMSSDLRCRPGIAGSIIAKPDWAIYWPMI